MDTTNIFEVYFDNAKSEGKKSLYTARNEKVWDALKWLKANNKCYSNIEIDFNKNETNNCLEDSDIHAQDDIEQFGVIATNYSAPSTDSLSLPRHCTAPVFIYSNAVDSMHMEEMAFPWLFTTGINGFKNERRRTLSLKDYFFYRMFSSDKRWRQDISYLLNAVNAYEQEYLLNLVNMHMCIRKPISKTTGLPTNLTAADVQDLSTNPDLLANSYMFMKSIRGTAAYWKNCLLDLLAMIRSLGPPTIFMTLSADDMHWKEIANVLQVNNAQSNARFVQQDPLLTAIVIHRRLEGLLKFVLLNGEKPLGEIEDYFIRVEFQNRGTAHFHCFFWVKDVPSFKDTSNKDKLLSYVNSVVKTSIPNDPSFAAVVAKYQSHRHTKYCQKQNRCRFGFPFRLCSKTCFKTIVDVSSEQQKGKWYETERHPGDEYINAYNPTVLKFWKANMDIQLINCAESAAYYVCAYLCKAEPEDLRAALADVIENFSRSPDSVPLKTQLLRIGNCVLKTRRLSAQEAAYPRWGIT